MINMWKGLSGSSLKWFAIITMFIDHVGFAVLGRVLLYYHQLPQGSYDIQVYHNIYRVMEISRCIGRLAFPVFCFLLVEGFLRTKNVYRYMVRMTLFALLSEIPFDLAFSAKLMNWEYQNVMLTLVIGIICMWGCSLVEKKWNGVFILKYLGIILCICLGMCLALALKTDYSFKGILSIMAIYLFRKDKYKQLLAGACTFIWEPAASLAFLPIAMYNGQRGMKMKYFFYWFYPCHLLFLYLLCAIPGIEWIGVI